MKKFILLIAAFCCYIAAGAQSVFTIVVKDNTSKQILSGATIMLLKNNSTAVTNSQGFASFANIPSGKQAVQISYTGYKSRTDTFDFPLLITGPLEILLQPEHAEMEEVFVQSTRTSRTIANTPTRVETIDAEELDEKSNMRPANVSMVLHESTGLQVQQTSATSGNASIRVQGLDGRYTQLLKDGYPNFGNFASGLSILEIPPLDLKQVEVIKGPSSTLYGGGAIAGVVNFVSKNPKEKGEYNFMLNQSHVGQTNIGGYAAQKKGKWGYTMLALFNNQLAYDVDKDGFSELPKSKSFTINPRLFFYPNKSVTLMLGNSFTQGNSMGGDMDVIKDNHVPGHVYFEKNITIRNTTTFEFDKKFAGRQSFKLKQSLSFFNRKISIPGYEFSGLNTNSFTEASYVFYKKSHTLIGGLNFIANDFKQRHITTAADQSTNSITAGLYAQDTWDITSKVKMEYGLRFDNARYKNSAYKNDQSFLLPRISVLYKITNKLSTRFGGGLGYKLPTIFTEQTETMQYQDILPLSGVAAEKSIGGTADLNYRTKLGEAADISINQLFYFTQINKPLVLRANSAGWYFINADKPITSKGFETNLKLVFKNDIKLFAGYTFTDAKNTYLPANQYLSLLPKHKVNLSLVYEKEDNFKIGLEGYYSGQQFLYNNTTTPAFWEFGAMAQKTFNKVSLFINFENFTDQRQSKYKGVVNPPYNNPTFDDIWNHTEGFVVNGGIKIKW